MKYIIILLSIVLLPIQTSEMAEIRLAYKEAAKDQSKVDEFHESLLEVTKKDPMALVAYKGASIALKAKYANTLKEKKDGFIEGVGLIEYAIETEPNNIESRFVRIGIQENTPKILKYKSNIPEDKAFIINQYSYISSKNLKAHIKDYIMQSSEFSDAEKQIIANQ